MYWCQWYVKIYIFPPFSLIILYCTQPTVKSFSDFCESSVRNPSRLLEFKSDGVSKIILLVTNFLLFFQFCLTVHTYLTVCILFYCEQYLNPLEFLQYLLSSEEKTWSNVCSKFLTVHIQITTFFWWKKNSWRNVYL